MNYIKKFMQDNDLKIGQVFKAVDRLFKVDAYYHIVNSEGGPVESGHVNVILNGVWQIEKIKKNKTLIEKIL